MPRDIDIVIERVRAVHPETKIEQLKVAHPGVDDDGLWYFGLPKRRQEIVVESGSGSAPFFVEHSGMKTTGEAITDASVEQTVEIVSAYLAELKKRGEPGSTDNSGASPLRV